MEKTNDLFVIFTPQVSKIRRKTWATPEEPPETRVTEPVITPPKADGSRKHLTPKAKIAAEKTDITNVTP